MFPTGGTRVLAYPAAHYAVADGQADYAFVYLNLRMAAGRSEAVKKKAGDELLARVRSHFEPVFSQDATSASRLQIDESPGQVYDGKHSNLHPRSTRADPQRTAMLSSDTIARLAAELHESENARACRSSISPSAFPR